MSQIRVRHLLIGRTVVAPVLLAAGVFIHPTRVDAQTYLIVGAGGNGGQGFINHFGNVDDGGGGGIGGGGGGGLYGGGGGGNTGSPITASQAGGIVGSHNFYGMGFGGGGNGGGATSVLRSLGGGAIGSVSTEGSWPSRRIGAQSTGTLNSATSTYSLSLSSGDASYDAAGIGGGGGGGSGYNGMLPNHGANGSNGANGQLTMTNSSAITITPSSTSYFLVGGSGGGAGNTSAGGNGGSGLVTMTDSAVLSSSYISIGGCGGGGDGGNSDKFRFYPVYGPGNVGGNGGDGTFVMSGSSHLYATTLLTIGGISGGGSGNTNANTGGGNGGNGSLVIGGSSYVSAQNIWLGGDAGIGLPGVYNAGQGGNGTLTVIGSSATVSLANSMLLGGQALSATPAPIAANTSTGGNGTIDLENGGNLILADQAVVTAIAPGNNPSLRGTATFGLSGVGNIEVDNSNSATISAVISDIAGGPAGVLTKNGTGTLTLTGANTYTGGTTINAGVLQIGTSVMPTNYSEAVTGPLTISITPNLTPRTGYSQLQVNGTATLAGLLTVNVAAPAAGDGYVIGSIYRVVVSNQQNGVNGAFSNTHFVGPNAQYLTAEMLYGSEEADIKLLASQTTIESGRFYAANGYAQNASLFDVLSAPMQADKGYWMHGIGSFGHAPDVNYNYKGFIAGRGISVSPNLVVGGAVSNVYTHTVGNNGSHVNGASFGAETYGIYAIPKYTFTTIVAAGHLGNSATRYLPGLGAGKFTTNGTYEGVSFHVNYDLLSLSHAFVTPYAQAGYLHTHMGSGRDAGLGTMNMRYGQSNTNLAQVGGGLTLGYKVVKNFVALTPWISIGGTGTLGNVHSRINETIGVQNASVTGRVASRCIFAPAAGIRLAGRNAPWKLSANWNGQFSKLTNGQAFTLNGRYTF